MHAFVQVTRKTKMEIHFNLNSIKALFDPMSVSWGQISRETNGAPVALIKQG